MKTGKQISWDKNRRIIIKIRKLQGYGRRQLHDQSEATWELCPRNENSTIGQNRKNGYKLQ
jgi:hypothetical protein